MIFLTTVPRGVPILISNLDNDFGDGHVGYVLGEVPLQCAAPV